MPFPKLEASALRQDQSLTWWLGEDLQPAMLDNPEIMVGRAAPVEIRTSVDSDGIMNRGVVAAWPNPDQANASGR